MNENDLLIHAEYNRKDLAIRKFDLDVPLKDFDFSYENCQSLAFFTIRGLSKFWDNNTQPALNELVGNILNSLNRHDVPFIYAIIGDESGISVNIGTISRYVSSVIASFQALIPGIDIFELSVNPLKKLKLEHGGLITGIPSSDRKNEIIDEETKRLNPRTDLRIENLCRAMMGKRFVYLVIAKGISPFVINTAHQKILDEMSETHEMIKSSASGGAQGNIQIEKKNYSVNNYFDDISLLQKHLKVGLSTGMWRINGYYASEDEQTANELASILRSSFNGKRSAPENYRTIPIPNIQSFISECRMITNFSESCSYHPIGTWQQTNREINLYSYKFQTILNSEQLALLCNLPTVELPGYYLDDFVEFDLAERPKQYLKKNFRLGEITDSGYKHWTELKNDYRMDRDDLTRHALIVGITGGGKTNTAKSILNSLWNDPQEKIPFLVIESAKREYWELRNIQGFEDLIVFTLGAEQQGNSVKYRLNPFECPAGVSLQTHIDYLLSAFQAAFVLYPPMPYALETAVYEVYSDKGWDISENTNRYGRTLYPTMSDLYEKIEVVVDRLGYDKEVQANVKAALKARIHSLMIGGKGAMLDTQRSVPIGSLLDHPVVMELEDLGDDNTRSFVIGMLLVQLYEFRKSQMNTDSQKLRHILLVEEAHRLLKNVPEVNEGNNSRAQSIEFFCNMLAEIRTYGQGIIISDQVPTKLAPDTIKNTNLKIVHRTVAEDDRITMGRSMNMTEAQIQYLSALERGFAAVYSEGDNKPKNVKFPLIKPHYYFPRADVLAESERKSQSLLPGYEKNVCHHSGCTFCESKCRYLDDVKTLIAKKYPNTAKLKEIMDEHKCGLSVIKRVVVADEIKEWVCNDIDKKLCLAGYLMSMSDAVSNSYKTDTLAAYLKSQYQ